MLAAPTALPVRGHEGRFQATANCKWVQEGWRRSCEDHLNLEPLLAMAKKSEHHRLTASIGQRKEGFRLVMDTHQFWAHRSVTDT